MKLSNILGTAILSLTFFACSHTVNTSENEETATETKVAVVANDAVDMKVEGMVCVNGCKGAIEKSLNGMAGIDYCDIDFENGIAHISFDNTQITDDEIQTAIESVNSGAYSAEFIDVNQETEAPKSSEEEINTAS